MTASTTAQDNPGRTNMNLQKRECPVSFRFVPYGSGWEDVYLTVNGEEHYFVVTGVWGDQANALAEVLLEFHPDYEHYYDPDPRFGIEDDAEIEHGPRLRAKFTWDGEGHAATWRLHRTSSTGTDAQVKVEIVEKDDDEDPESPIRFTVGYKDLCYAVAKGMTETMKRHGVYGYFQAVWSHDINLRKLLFLKAFALDAMDVLKVEDLGRGNGERTDFAKELELLLFDM